MQKVTKCMVDFISVSIPESIPMMICTVVVLYKLLFQLIKNKQKNHTRLISSLIYDFDTHCFEIEDVHLGCAICIECRSVWVELCLSKTFE